MATLTVLAPNPPKKKGSKRRTTKKRRTPPRNKDGTFRKRKKASKKAKRKRTKARSSSKKRRSRTVARAPRKSSKKRRSTVAKKRKSSGSRKRKSSGSKKRSRKKSTRKYKRNPGGKLLNGIMPKWETITEGLVGAGGGGVFPLWLQKVLIKDDFGPWAYGIHWLIGQVTGHLVKKAWKPKMGDAIQKATNAIVAFRIFQDFGPKIRPEGMLGDYMQTDLLGGPKAFEIPASAVYNDGTGDYEQVDFLGESYPPVAIGDIPEGGDAEIIPIGGGDDLMDSFAA